MKIVIVGAGAIGMLLGAKLARGAHEVVFVEINGEAVAAINQQGVGFIGTGQESSEVVFEKATAVSDASQIQECDAVVLAVKSFDTETAIRSVSHLVSKESPVLSVQTGIGNLETIVKVERRKNVLGGFTYMAGAALGPGRVRLGGMGVTYLGELDGKITPRAEYMCKAFNESGIECKLESQIVKQLWCKVLVYSAINPLTGLMRVKNGQLIGKMEAITLAKRLIDEGRQVAEAYGVGLSGFDLYDLFFDTCKQTADNISSMLLDLISGRRTEIDALNGEIIRLGQEMDLPVATHLTIMELVKLGEKWGGGFQQPV